MFWLFGGDGIDSQGNRSNLNDLWEFNPSTSQWTWVSGAKSVPCSVDPTTGVNVCAPPSGTYGTLGVPASGNTPGGRAGASSWVDSSGDLWIFGGTLNDVWVFNPTSSQWAWMNGDAETSNCIYGLDSNNPEVTCGNSPGLYAGQYTFAVDSAPAARYGAVSWAAPNGNLWLFGGGSSVLQYQGTVDGWTNDVWEYQPSTSTLPPAAIPVFSLIPGAYVSTGPLSISNGMSNATIYYTTDGSTPTTASTKYSGPLDLSSSETVKAMATAPGYVNSAIASASYAIDTDVATPVFSLASGTYTAEQALSITDATVGAAIHYTTDGSDPTLSLPVYYGSPIYIDSSETVRAMAVLNGYAFHNGMTMAGGHARSPIASVSFTINYPTFTLQEAPGSLALNNGAKGTITLTLTPEYGFNSAINLSCSGLPSGASCSFNPATVTPNGSAATTTLTVTAPTKSAMAKPMRSPWVPMTSLALVVWLFGLRKHHKMLRWLMLLIACAGLGLISACGGGGSSGGGGGGGSTPTSSTVTVTATSGSIQQTTSFTLTVD